MLVENSVKTKSKSSNLPKLELKKSENYLYWVINNMLKTFNKQGDFNCFSKFKTTDVNVGFYQGLSGIGYQLLRFLQPDEYKSVLLFK